jgi:hypothetical protein
MENNNQLILEVGRIQEIMGVQLITESPSPQVLDNILTVLRKVFKPTGNAVVDYAIRTLETKVSLAARQNRRVLIGDVIDDLVKISQNQIYGDIIGKQLIKLYPESKQIIKDVLKTVDFKNTDQLVLKQKLKDGFNNYYTNAGRNITDPLYINIRDLILNDKYITRIKSTRNLFSRLKSVSTPESIKLFNSIMSGWWKSADSLQQKFIEVSDRAVSKIENNKDITSELKEMFRILAATKKMWNDQPKYTLNTWLESDFFKNHPKGPELAADFRKLLDTDEDYKELWDALQNTDFFGGFNFIEQVKRYRSLWPFKSPKSPDGYAIFSNKFSPSRVAAVLIGKSARNVTDLNKLLLSRGVYAGTIRWILQRFVMIYFLHPLFISYFKASIDLSEELASIVTSWWGGEPVDWIEFEDVPDEFRKQSYIFMKEVGEEYGKSFTWWDNQTYLNEIYDFHLRLFCGKDGVCQDKAAKEYKRRQIQAAAAFGPEIQNILETGQIPTTITSNQKNSPIKTTSSTPKTV